MGHREMKSFSRLLALGLALLLTIYAFVSYPLALVGEMAMSTLLLVMVLMAKRWLDTNRPTINPRIVLDLLPSPCAIFLLVFSATVTVQTLVARDIYGLLSAVDRAPSYALVARLFHYAVVVAIVWL